MRVNRTKHSDIVDTLYFGTEGINSNENNQIYIRNGEMIFNTEYKSEIEATARGLDAGVRYYDDRVAFITKEVIDETYCYLIKVYDDKTGELIKIINTTKEYNSALNIQCVGERFLIVNMIEDNENDEVFSKGLVNPDGFKTTVIELGSGKVTPIYQQLENKDVYLTNAMNSVSFIPYGIPPSDGIMLDNRDGNKLNFVCFPNYDDEVKYQYTLGA